MARADNLYESVLILKQHKHGGENDHFYLFLSIFKYAYFLLLLVILTDMC